AWANGIPVIAYRAGGVADLIRHRQDGLLVRGGDLPGLTEAIRFMAGCDAVRQGMGRAGQCRVGREVPGDDKLRIARNALVDWSDQCPGAVSRRLRGKPKNPRQTRIVQFATARSCSR